MVLHTDTPHRLLTDDADDHNLLPTSIITDQSTSTSAAATHSLDQIVNHTNDIDRLLHPSINHQTSPTTTTPSIQSSCVTEPIVSTTTKTDFVIQDDDAVPTSLDELVVEANGAEEEPEEW